MRLVFFQQKQIEVLIKLHTSYLECITKVYTGIFLLKSIPATFTKFYSPLIERTNYTQPICVILINKILCILADGKARVNICNFMHIGKISFVVYMHILNE